MKILVAGGSGQLGRALVRTAVGHQLLAPDRGRFDVTDATAVEALLMQERPEVVVNAAAWTDVDGCERDPARARAVHVDGARHLARACLRAQAHLVHVSTDYVFDGQAGRPYTEDDVPNPIQVYGRSKHEGEGIVAASRGRTLIVRTSWLYDLDDPKGFVQRVLERASRGEPFEVVADQIGTPTPVALLAASIFELVEHRMEGLVHRAGPAHRSRAAFAREILASAGTDPGLVRDGVTQPGDGALRPRDTSLESIRPTVHRGPAGTTEDCAC